MSTATDPYRILTVCTGNICRSPMAERLLQAGLDEMAPGEFLVTSAGTGALIGSGIEPHVAGFVNVFGADSGNFAARQLSARVLQEQDLPATAAFHRSAAGTPEGTSTSGSRRASSRSVNVRRSMPGTSSTTLLRCARLSASTTLRVRTAHPASPDQDDVVDPYGRADAVYQQMVRELAPAVETLLAWERAHR